MTVAEAIRAAAERLSETTDTARIDAELLMAHALGVSRSDMLLRHTADSAPAIYDELIESRARHEPVAYITGAQEFFGREFIVTPDVLIPRGDSEVLVDVALELAPDAKRVLDLGTGSGCLLISALAELPEAEGVGIDASLAATAVAAANAARLGVADRAHILHASWRADDWAADLGGFDLIVCNPPYVETTADLDPDVREYEPSSALFAGSDGLDDYRILIPQIRPLMRDNSIALFEIGASQAREVFEIAKENGFEAQIRPDLAGRDRVAILT